MSAAARCFFGKKRKNADKWAKKSAESLSLSADFFDYLSPVFDYVQPGCFHK